MLSCDEKDSGCLQNMMCLAQNNQLFGDTMEYTPLGMTYKIGVENFKLKLRRQNQYEADMKTLALYHVDKPKMKTI